MDKYDRDFWTISGLTKGQLSPMIQEHIKEGIRLGVLKPGDKIPPHRTLAKHMDISRTAVRGAYDKLQEQGWLHSEVGNATTIAHHFPNYEAYYPSTMPIAELPVAIKPNADFILPSNGRPFIRIGCNMLQQEYFPLRQLFPKLEMAQKYYKSSPEFLQAKSRHERMFKMAILAYLNSQRLMGIGRDNLEVLFDRRASLKKVLGTLLSPNELLINTSVEDLVLRELLQSLNIRSIDLDMTGLAALENLEKLLGENTVKALYVRPQCSGTEGFSIPPGDCIRLIEMAKKHQFYIIEEEEQHEFWHKLPYKALVRYDHKGHVIHLSAFSQLDTYLYDTRVLVAAREFITAVSTKGPHSTFSRNLPLEAAFMELIQDGKFAEQVIKVRQLKRLHCFECHLMLSLYFAKHAQINEPDSGLNIWMVFPEKYDILRILDTLIAAGEPITYELSRDVAKERPNAISFCFGTWNASESEALAKAIVAQLET